jgi:hypothetical protein
MFGKHGILYRIYGKLRPHCAIVLFVTLITHGVLFLASCKGDQDALYHILGFMDIRKAGERKCRVKNICDGYIKQEEANYLK